jgi:hypothetical protein
LLFLRVAERSKVARKEGAIMFPGVFPPLPATVFPLVGLVPFSGISAVDVTAALAVLAWAVGVLVAVRIAVRLTGDRDLPTESTSASPSGSGPRRAGGFRDAA